MAKSILGDDPFAQPQKGKGEEEKGEKVNAAPARSSKAQPQKSAGKTAAKAKAKPKRKAAPKSKLPSSPVLDEEVAGVAEDEATATVEAEAEEAAAENPPEVELGSETAAGAAPAPDENPTIVGLPRIDELAIDKKPVIAVESTASFNSASSQIEPPAEKETTSSESASTEAAVAVEAKDAVETDAPSVETPSTSAAPEDAAASPPVEPAPAAHDGAAPHAPPVGERPPPSEYGPSIDQPPPPGHRRALLDEVRRIEERVLHRSGAQLPARRKIPLEPLWKRWRALAMRDRSDVVDEFGRDPQVASRTQPLLDFLYKSYFRVDAQGLGHIPERGRALIVANHSGTLPYDGAMIMHAVRKEHAAAREVRPLVEDFVFHFPYLGTLMNRIGGVRACQENAARLLQADQLVAVFPEGIKGIGKLYAQRYQLQRFGRGGFVKLALGTDSPIIPTAVVGAEEIHPMFTRITWLAKPFGIPYLPITPTFPWLGPLGLVPLPTKWYIAFGEPLYFNAEYGSAAANDRILVNKLAEQVRQRIQEMIDTLLQRRRSVLFG